MTFVKTSLLNGIAVVIKMLTLLGINKVLAIYVGPSGYATIGQYQNAVQIITTFASGAINTGVTKYTAEYYENPILQRSVWSTAGVISVTGTIIAASIIALFSDDLSVLLLGTSELSSVFYWLAAGLVFFVLNSLLLAILNGKKEIKLYVTANIAGSLLSFVLTIGLAISFGLYGALVALSIYQSVAFIATAYLCYKADWFQFSYLFGKIDRQVLIKLSKFSLMVAVSAACVPLSQMLIRDFLGDTFGISFSGLWEALTRLSGAYLMLITTTLSVYFLPRYSEITDKDELRREVVNGILIIVPFAIVCSFIVYILRDFIVLVLFSEEFLPVTDLIAWQVVGDTLKIASWMLGFLLWAKALVLIFIVTEVLFSFGFYFLTVLFTSMFEKEGVVIAYAINYFLYFSVLTVYFYFWFNKENKVSEKCVL